MKAENIRNALSCGKPGCPCGRRRGNTHCPSHDDPKPSLSVKDADGKVLIKCFAGCTNAAVIDALKERGLWPKSSHTGSKAVETRWKIKDTAGNVVAVHCRVDRRDGDKDMWWELPDGTKSLNGKPLEELPLYGCEKLADLPDYAVVVVTEGEKAADALNGRGVAAVGTVTGAGGVPGRESLAVLLPHYVILWPDNDPHCKGRKHMEFVAQRLTAMGCREVRTVQWADAPDKGDAADFTGSDEELKALLAAAPRYELAPDVDLAALLEDVRDYIRQYVVLSDAQADAVVLWVAHTHAFDAAESTPYLSVTSAEKRSGKTRLLEAFELIVARPWLTGRTTAAALYRRIDAERPTLLLDESDSAFRSGEEYAETLRGVLNTGHRRGGAVTVCVGQGANMSYGIFSTFSAKAVAGIGKLPDTVEDRAIAIVLKRKAPGEKAARFKWRKAREAAAPLKEKLGTWASTSETLRDAEPEIPSELDDRAADGWEPLLAIADAAGGEWPKRARKAALALSVGDSREDDSLGVRLLRDIRDIFTEKKVDRLTCAKLVKALVGLEEAPWADIRGKSLDTRRLGWRLRPFGIRSRTIRLDDGNTARGYLEDMFVDEWVRYCPTPKEPTQPIQPSQTPDTDTGDVSVVTDVSVSQGMSKQDNNDGQRTYLLSLAEVLGWPAVSLGERGVNGRTVSVGVPVGRSAWAQAARYWPDDLLAEVLTKLEAMA